MNYTKVLVPIFIVLALVYFFFLKPDTVKEEGIFGTLGEHFFIDVGSIDRIELSNDGESVTITRNGDLWNLESPIKSPADTKSVTSLISGVLTNPIHRTLSESEMGDLSEYGLNVDTIPSITFYGQSKALLDLSFGDETLTGTDVYTHKGGGGEILLVDVKIKNSLDFTPDQFRAKTPIRIDEKSLRSITISYPDSHWKLEKDSSSGKWSVTEPDSFRANASKINRLVAQLNVLEITKFTAEKYEGEITHGLDAPRVKVELLSTVNGTVQSDSFMLGDTDVAANAIYARFSSLPSEDVLVESHILNKLQITDEDIRDYTLISIDPLNIASLDVRERDTENLSIFMTENGKWQKLSPTPGAVLDGALEDFFKMLLAINSSKHISQEQLDRIDPESTGLELYKAKIEIKQKGDYGDLAIVIGKKDEEGYYYFALSDMEGAYRVDSKLIDAFFEANERLKL